MKPRILVFCDFYLPGFKSGGGMWTVVNLVDRFCDQFDFFIVTRNHDGRSDTDPYTSVKTGEWNSVGNAQVYFASNDLITQRNFESIILEILPSIVYLNSVFCTLAIKFLALRRRGRSLELPVVLAPCGELSEAALAIKSTKKRVFLTLARIFGIHDRVIWKASTEMEAREIRTAIGRNVRIMNAPDLPPRHILPDFSIDVKPPKAINAVTLCFVSRVDRKKNLHFLLEALKPVRDGKVVFKIVGPHEDAEYWAECQSIINSLPDNILVEVAGGIPYDQVLEQLKSSHFFVLPTLNENFGYVFIEAMAAGCPIIISDRTIWKDIERASAGFVLELDENERWTSEIRKLLAMEQSEFSRMAAAAREYAVKWLEQESIQDSVSSVLSVALNENVDLKERA